MRACENLVKGTQVQGAPENRWPQVAGAPEPRGTVRARPGVSPRRLSRHSGGGAEPLEISGEGKDPVSPLERDLVGRRLATFKFWKQRAQYCSCLDQLRPRQLD